MLENTDEEHYITMPEIKEKLEEYEVTADRKSIYNDLKDLEKLGIEVEGEPVGNRYHYHVVERPFELLILSFWHRSLPPHLMIVSLYHRWGEYGTAMYLVC